jgi:type III restriction enzyme
MKLKFDANQQYQLDAVNAVVSVFDGQPLNQGDFEVTVSQEEVGSLFAPTDVIAVGNRLAISEEQLLKNIQATQLSKDLEPDSAFKGNHFSVEMETGTGKTYVYLRSIFELNRKYGFKKFIIVVPSVAIREGVLKNLEITQEHFKALFNNVAYEYFVYDAKRINRLRSFATGTQIQILVINIDAFRKNFTGTEEEQKSNVIYKRTDRLNDRMPIEFIQATQPIVIIDEPQSVDNTEKAKEAIAALNPLCTLRYSATHRNPYHLVYRLDPIKAYSMRLVKQIVVASVTGSTGTNAGYVKLKKIDYGKGKKPTAKIAIHVKGESGIKEKELKIKGGEDLYTLSGEREPYRDGYEITEIYAEPGNEYIQFSSGKRLALGQEIGGLQGDIWKVQIKNTIKRHLDKEIQVKGRGIKVLSLFFIDKVANYRSYDEEGKPQKGKFAIAFEEALAELLKQDTYKDLLNFPVEKLHDGYFAQDKKGVLKDSSEARSTQADDEVYEKIMKNKEQLLSLEEPLRFIFSHSALREGWDNPNVFQICTLNETRSVMKKRQEIGRGLRIPVNQSGDRVFDDNLNKLLIVANESYEEFARNLQNEYEEECGVTFGKVPLHAFSKIVIDDGAGGKALGLETSKAIIEALKAQGILNQDGKILEAFDPQRAGFKLELPPEVQELSDEVIDTLRSYQLERHIKRDEERYQLKLKKQVLLDEEFQKLWKTISVKTTYSVEFKTEDLIRNSVKAIDEMERIQPIRVAYVEANLEIENKGVSGTVMRQNTSEVIHTGALPDILAYLQNETELTRSTLCQILTQSKRLKEFFINPQAFMDQVAQIVRAELHKLMIDGIKYEKLPSTEPESEWDMRLFESKEIEAYLSNRLEVQHSIYDAIVYDSEVERRFAEELDRTESVKLFVKLPYWFKIETPLGTYNPDWAILKHDQKALYLVRETKSTKNFEKLRTAEAEKIKCGRRHFEELGVDFAVVAEANEV